MEIIEYNSKKLFEFYNNNGLEFDDDRGYLGNNIKSYVVLDNQKIVGAITTSIYKNQNFIEALVVDREYRNQEIGKTLLKKVIKELQTPIYTISKLDEFYLKNGFTYDNADLIDKECKTCKNYNVTCFPKVVVYK